MASKATSDIYTDIDVVTTWLRRVFIIIFLIIVIQFLYMCDLPSTISVAFS